MKEFVPMTCDFALKEIMDIPLVRKYFVSDVTGIPVEEIKSIRIVNPFLWRRRRNAKLGILDLQLELNNNTRINIEMQVKYFARWDRRNLFYLAKMFTEDLKSGEKYDRLKKCICISILDFNLTGRPEYHSVYRLRDEKGYEFSDLFEIHTIELKKKLNGEDRVDDWIRLFNAKTEEELDMIKTSNPGIREAMKELRVMSLGKRLRLIHEEHLKEIRDRHMIEDEAREQGHAEGFAAGQEEGERVGRAEGRAEGREEGREQKLLDQIGRKLAKGQSVEQIAEALEEEPEVISRLIQKLESKV